LSEYSEPGVAVALGKEKVVNGLATISMLYVAGMGVVLAAERMTGTASGAIVPLMKRSGTVPEIILELDGQPKSSV
jgi:hypothetical protein